MDSITVVNPFDKLGFSVGIDKIASMIKAGDYKLPEDPAQWNAAIQDALQSQHPETVKAGSNPHIIYKHSDWGSGCALGSVSIAVGKALVVFPVVIRYGNLAPFDMVYDHNEDRWMHTSEENMRSFASGDESLFGSVTTTKMTGDNDYEDRWEYLRAPRGYDYKGASLIFENEASMASCPIEPLVGAVKYAQDHSDRLLYSPDHVVDLFKKASASAKLVSDAYLKTESGKKAIEKYGSAHFEEPTTTETTLPKPIDNVKDSIFDLESSGKIKNVAEAAGEIPVEIDEYLDSPAFKSAAYDFFDIVLIKKASLGSYDISMGRRGFEGIFSVNGDIDKVAEVFFGNSSVESLKTADKILDAVDDAGSLLIDSAPDDSDDIHSEILGDANVVDDSKRISRYGVYEVFTEAGERQVGHVLPVFDWSGDQSQAFLFISECNWALQSNINGKASGRQAVLPNGVIRPERRGAFVYDSNGKGIALPPIEIKSVLSKKTGMVIRGTDLGSMKALNLVLTKDTPGVMEFTEFNDPETWIAGHVNVYVPIGAKFVPLPADVTKIASAEEAIKKLDLKLATTSDSSIGLRKKGGQFFVSAVDGLYPYPTAIREILKEASSMVYDDRVPLGAKEAEFALRLSGGIMSDSFITLIKEGKVLDVPAELPENVMGIREAMIKSAELNNQIEMPGRYKSAAEHLRIPIEQVLNVVTVAPHLKKFADEILPKILDMEGIYASPLDFDNKRDSFKGAAYEDRPTLDDLFELGFLNDKNLRHFLAKQQDVEELEDFLCKVLMATRIAGFGMEEDSAQNALYGVSELKNVLARINFKIHGSD